VTVTVVRNSLDEGHTFGGYSVGSWNRDRCCQADSNDCESDGHCWDHSAVDDFLFGLGPALGRFDVSGSTDTVPYGYQFVSPGWPCWGGSGGIGDLCLGDVANDEIGRGGTCNQGTVLPDDHYHLCGANSRVRDASLEFPARDWGETQLEVWRRRR